MRKADESVRKEHFIENYYDNGEKFFTHDTERMRIAFSFAEAYSRTHGFRIFNAARGGQLEAFERVNFDNLWG
jgi:hypothetical protein